MEKEVFLQFLRSEDEHEIKKAFDAGWNTPKFKRELQSYLELYQFFENPQMKRVGKLKPHHVKVLNNLRANSNKHHMGKIKVFPEGIYHLHRLEKLDIGYNKFESLPDAIGQLVV